MSAGNTTDPRLSQWIIEARQLGAEQARNAASWITDGNDTDDSRRLKLQRIQDDGPDAILNRPNLSCEYADEMSPRRLFEEITGLDAHAAATWNVDAYGAVIDELAAAYEDGVSETFEDACVAELNRWLS